MRSSGAGSRKSSPPPPPKSGRISLPQIRNAKPNQPAVVTAKLDHCSVQVGLPSLPGARRQSTATAKSPAPGTRPKLASSGSNRRHGGGETLGGQRLGGDGLCFTTTKGTPVDPRNLLRAFYAVLKRSGLPRIRFHDLRHSAASLLIAQGVHPRMIMELLLQSMGIDPAPFFPADESWLDDYR